jgi:starvation-inducible DNA-binding protein
MATKLHPTKNDLPPRRRAALVDLLNASLATAIDLEYQAKQAHWNVKGPRFIALHELFDDVAEMAEEAVDELAERAVQLGGTARGTVRVAAKGSRLSEYPLDAVSGDAHVAALSGAIAAYAEQLRTSIAEAEELEDAATADLFTQLVQGADKHLWFVEAHLEGKS